MRLRGIHAANVNPIKLLSVEDLSDVVVITGLNGVGKTGLIETTQASFQNPSSFLGTGSQAN